MAARGKWSSSLGFVLAAAGSAIGIGNIWRFPYMTGKYGGAAFLFVYLAAVVLLGMPVLIAEIAMGRFTGKNPVGAFKELRPRGPLETGRLSRGDRRRHDPLLLFPDIGMDPGLFFQDPGGRAEERRGCGDPGHIQRLCREFLAAGVPAGGFPFHHRLYRGQRDRQRHRKGMQVPDAGAGRHHADPAGALADAARGGERARVLSQARFLPA